MNLGTRGVAEAADLLENANHPAGTALSDRRRANGRDEPFGVRLLVPRNEMDGPLADRPQDRRRVRPPRRRETARMMRFIDPGVELVAAGSSNHEMPTFGEWERTVLRHTAAGLIDHISVHALLRGDPADPRASSPAAPPSTATSPTSSTSSTRSAPRPRRRDGPSASASRRVERVEPYPLETRSDKPRVFTGDWPIAPPDRRRLHRHRRRLVAPCSSRSSRRSDRVSMANLAQLVNVIAPIPHRARRGRGLAPEHVPPVRAHREGGIRSVILPRVEGP